MRRKAILQDITVMMSENPTSKVMQGSTWIRCAHLFSDLLMLGTGITYSPYANL